MPDHGYRCAECSNDHVSELLFGCAALGVIVVVGGFVVAESVEYDQQCGIVHGRLFVSGSESLRRADSSRIGCYEWSGRCV